MTARKFKTRNFLHKSNLLIAFFVDKGVPIHARASAVTLYAFYKTLGGYVDKRPVNQDGYFDFKDRYNKATKHKYVMDHFIAEDYVLMWQSLEQLRGHQYPWQDWTGDFMKIKDLDLSSLQIETQEELDAYLKGHEGLGAAFNALVGWGENSQDLLKEVVWLLKHEALIVNVAEDSSFGRRYLSLLDSGLLSISEIELIKKPVAYEQLIRAHLAVGREKMDEIERKVTVLPKRQRALMRTILHALRRQSRCIDKNPDVLFLKPPSYFKVFVWCLSWRFLWYQLTGLFEKPPAL